MKRYALSIMIMISSASFAYDIPATSFKNQLPYDLQVWEMYASDRVCNLQGVYPGMIWRQGQTIRITGSCSNNNDYVKVEFETVGHKGLVGFAIEKNQASMWYNEMYKTKTAQDQKSLEFILNNDNIT